MAYYPEFWKISLKEGKAGDAGLPAEMLFQRNNDGTCILWPAAAEFHLLCNYCSYAAGTEKGRQPCLQTPGIDCDFKPSPAALAEDGDLNGYLEEGSALIESPDSYDGPYSFLRLHSAFYRDYEVEELGFFAGIAACRSGL